MAWCTCNDKYNAEHNDPTTQRRHHPQSAYLPTGLLWKSMAHFGAKFLPTTFLETGCWGKTGCCLIVILTALMLTTKCSALAEWLNVPSFCTERERPTLLGVIYRYISDSLKGVSLILCGANFERGWFEPLWNITFFCSFVFSAHSSVLCSAVVSKRKNTQEENGVHYTMTCITLRVTKPCGTVTLWPRPTDCEERSNGYDTLRSSSVYIPSYFCYDID